MDQTQARTPESVRMKPGPKPKDTPLMDMAPKRPTFVQVGYVQMHGVLFFGGKNFKEKIDVRTDKARGGGSLDITYDRDTKELTIRGEGCVMHLPSTSVFGYTPIDSLAPKVTPFSGVGANTKLNAQVSGPHDHVFAGLGQGQTGAGKAIK
jgi:hypothetical protein